MSIKRSGEGSQHQPLRSEPKYEVSVAIYNEKSGKWERASSDVGEKASQFVKQSGMFEIVAQSQSGDVLEFTESGIYKKGDEGWVKALSKEEAEKQSPSVNKAIEKLSIWQTLLPKEETSEITEPVVSQVFTSKFDPNESKMIIQVRILDKTPPDITSLKESLKESHSQLSDLLSLQVNKVKELQEEHALLMQNENIDPKQHQELLNKIEMAEQLLGVMIGTAKTAIFAETKLKEPQKSEVKQIGSGKAKLVYTHDKRPGHVYYTAVPQSFLNTKETEIQQEVKTAGKIARNLFEADLRDLLKKNELPEKAIKELLSKYKTPNEIHQFLEGENPQSLSQKLSVHVNDAAKIIDLKAQILELGELDQNLAVDLTEVSGEERIEGKYTVRTSQALNDLEIEIQKDQSLDNKIHFVSGLFNGMERLHRSGHVHGDLKPENLLVYQNQNVKISDFGKTRSVGENEKVMYTGNPRFAPPEKKLSQKGEVYSTALIAIRVLEEGFLIPENQMLFSPYKQDPNIEPSPERRGIEKFAIINSLMTQTEGSSLRGKVRAYGPSFLSTSVNVEDAELEIQAYIDVLTSHLEKTKESSPKKIKQLNGLLKQMTLSDPAKRPTMAEVNRSFKEIGLP